MILELLPLAFRWNATTRHFGALARQVFLVSGGQAVRLSDRLQVARGLRLVACPTDGGQTIRIIRVGVRVAQRKGRAMVEDKEAEDQPRAAIRTPAVLPQKDLGTQPIRQKSPAASIKGQFAIHDFPHRAVARL